MDDILKKKNSNSTEGMSTIPAKHIPSFGGLMIMENHYLTYQTKSPKTLRSSAWEGQCVIHIVFIVIRACNEIRVDRKESTLYRLFQLLPIYT